MSPEAIQQVLTGEVDYKVDMSVNAQLPMRILEAFKNYYSISYKTDTIESKELKSFYERINSLCDERVRIVSKSIDYLHDFVPFIESHEDKNIQEITFSMVDPSPNKSLPIRILESQLNENNSSIIKQSIDFLIDVMNYNHTESYQMFNIYERNQI